MNINISIEWNKSHWVIWFNIVFSFGNGETHHNNKYMGTKKHQLNGVELTSTAIGIEIGNFAVNSPPPILIFLHCNTPISYISQIYSESRSKNNSSIVRVEVTYPSYNSHNTDEIKSIIHNNIPHHIWNCPQANQAITCVTF